MCVCVTDINEPLLISTVTEFHVMKWQRYNITGLVYFINKINETVPSVLYLVFSNLKSVIKSNDASFTSSYFSQQGGKCFALYNSSLNNIQCLQKIFTPQWLSSLFVCVATSNLRLFGVFFFFLKWNEFSFWNDSVQKLKLHKSI